MAKKTAKQYGGDGGSLVLWAWGKLRLSLSRGGILPVNSVPRGMKFALQ